MLALCLGASPVPDRRRVPPDMYERYGGPPPHVMGGHHPREFRPPLHHESGKLHSHMKCNHLHSDDVVQAKTKKKKKIFSLSQN